MSTFFRNVDSRTNRDVDIGDGKQPIYDLKARAILIDMETGPVSETNRGELGDLFDERQFVTGVSGAGNNWAHGHAVYGPEYYDELLEVRLYIPVEALIDLLVCATNKTGPPTSYVL